MKKSSIFIIIVAFIVSIFIISNFGLSVRTDHMKSYINNIDITHCLLMDGKRVDYEWLGSGANKRKVVRVDFSQQEGSIGLYINYNVERASNVESILGEDFVFEIESGNETFEVIENEEVVTYNYADMLPNRNKLTLNHICTIRIVLKALDGSGKDDRLTVMCRDYGGNLK